MTNAKDVMKNKVSRRTFISGVSAGLGAAAAVSFAAGCGGSSPTAPVTPTTPASPTYTDFDLLNFALNLEYIEAEYYLRAVTGQGLATADAGTGTGLGTVNGGTQVTFTTSAVAQYAAELAADEQLHVQFLRAAITSLGGTPVPRPQIDFTAGFAALGTAANLGAAFNPFSSEANFLLGAFAFEDVGVTAYDGAAPLITSDANKAAVIAAAGSIVAVEAYHAGLVRYLISQSIDGTTIASANAIQAVRTTADIAVTGGVSEEVTLSATQLVPSNATTSLIAPRTFDQLLHILYLNQSPGATSKGGFFPNGLNGTITASAS